LLSLLFVPILRDLIVGWKEDADNTDIKRNVDIVWIDLVQDMVQQQASVNTVTNLCDLNVLVEFLFIYLTLVKWIVSCLVSYAVSCWIFIN
jgi:hypothetical protein